MVDFSDEEVEVILSALAKKKETYRSLREEPDGVTEEAAGNALEVVESVEEKLKPEIPVVKPEGTSVTGEFLYIYVPDGIRDRELEEEFASRIPETEEPEPDNFFWSNKFENFVVKSDYADLARESIKERYNGNVVLKENPGWAKGNNTWQILRKEDVENTGESREGASEGQPPPP